jgi:hypothetical protein
MNDKFGITSSDFISPNQHDFDQLEEIYEGGGGNCPPNSQSPKCPPSPQRDFGPFTPVVHVIPAPVPGS